MTRMEMIYEDILDDIERIEPVPDDDDVADGLFPDLTDIPTDFSKHGAGISVTLRSMEAGNCDGIIGALSEIVREVDYVVGSCHHV